MTATSSPTIPDVLDARPRRIAPTVARTWAFTGAAAGLAGIVAIQASLANDAVYNEEYAGDAVAITDRLGDFVPQLLVLHVGTMVAAVLLLVFAAGLRRRLEAQAPTGSLLPSVAAGGLLLTSVACLMGGAFTTEIVFGLEGDVEIDPEFAAVVGHWVGTVPWLWIGAGVTGVAVAVAALRHQAAPRWIGWGSAVLGGITLLFGLSPLQYMAGFTGPVLVLALGLGFALGDRRFRTGR